MKISQFKEARKLLENYIKSHIANMGIILKIERTLCCVRTYCNELKWEQKYFMKPGYRLLQENKSKYHNQSNGLGTRFESYFEQKFHVPN